MTIGTHEEIEQEYLSMYGKPMKKEEDNDKNVCACSMYEW